MDLATVALALGSSLAAGLNLYLTVLTLGLLQYFEFVHLPPDLEVLAHPAVLTAAALLALVEFVADKVPYVDNTWDFVHSFIRIPAGALLAAGALADLPAHWLWMAALLGGFVAFTSHGAKATARLAVNSTPEPFTNWFLSFGEDMLVLLLLWLVSEHPLAALVVALAVLALCLAVILLMFQLFRLIFRRRPRFA